MRSNPIESAPSKLYEQREINWGFANLAEMHPSPPRGWQRFGINAAALFVTAGLAMMFVPSVLTNWAGQWETEDLSVAGSTPVATQRSSQDAADSPDSAIKHQLAAEQERQRGEVLAHELALAREDLGTLAARVTALTDARTEAEKALQTARASASEQKLGLEQERQRGDALLRELASAREEVEARKAAANAADAASAKNSQASATEQTQAAEQERQRGKVLAHELASARVDVETLMARVTALTEERSEAEKALQTAQASAAEQKLALEQERQRGVLSRDLASEREDVEVRKAGANAADASAKNAHTSSSVRTVSAGGSKDIETGSGSLTAASKLLVLPTRQKSEPVWPNPPGAVSAARSDDGLAQVPEMAPPVSRRSGQRAAEANGQSLRALPRENPPQRMTGREHRETPRSNYSSIRLFGD